MIASQPGTSEQQAIAVSLIASGSPAAQAGIQRRDIITEVDGKALRDDSDLAQVLNAHKPGDTLTLTVVRGGKTLPVKVKLDETPS